MSYDEQDIDDFRPLEGDQKVDKKIVITAPRFTEIAFEIVGTAPYVQSRFTEKAKKKIQETQAEGTKSRNNVTREERKPADDYKRAMHIAKEGWHGIPAAAFRNACISACRISGFKMTVAKLTIFCVQDGYDKNDGTPLVAIRGKPRMHTGTVRNANGSTDMRYRPMWEQWSATVRLKFDLDQFSHEDVANLMMRAGLQVGIGEGRPGSRDSSGIGWGTFELRAG